MDIQNKPQKPEEESLQIFDRTYYPSREEKTPPKIEPIKLFAERIIQDQIDENNDSSTSTTTSRSVHLPVEKQRGLSEIIRKRNSRSKVEDYKRSIQKSNTFDELELINPTLSTSKSDQELIALSSSDTNSKTMTKTSSIDMSIDVESNTIQRAQLSIERLNVLLSNKEQQNVSNEYG